MNGKIAVITPSGDRPDGFWQLHATYMPRQTLQPDYWFVADDGTKSYFPNDFVSDWFNYYRYPRSNDKAIAFTNQVVRLCTLIELNKDIEYVVIMEDDDWYSEKYIETRVDQLKNGAIIAGTKNALYYNVHYRMWRTCGNNHRASFCETAFHISLLPKLKKIAKKLNLKRSCFVDAELWKHCSINNLPMVLDNERHCIGIKGVPGRKGVGIGHRPNNKPCWKSDLNHTYLKELIGVEDTSYYNQLKYYG